MKSIRPTHDLLFKKALGSPEHTDILKGFIHDFFGFMPEEVILENPYSIHDFKELQDGGDSSVLRQTHKDITASLKTAAFTAEMQVRKTDFYDRRALYYAFDTYCSYYNRPDETRTEGCFINRYASLRPVYAMNILGHTYFEEDDDALRIFEIYDIKHKKQMKEELLRVAFFELTKTTVETDNQRHWRTFFTTGTVNDDAPDYIKTAGKIVDYTNLRKEEQSVIDRAEKARADYEAELSTARRIAREQGMAQGMERGMERGILYGAARLYRRTRERQLVDDVYPNLRKKEWDAILEAVDTEMPDLENFSIPVGDETINEEE